VKPVLASRGHLLPGYCKCIAFEPAARIPR
jgi:hypothetical protein